MNSIIESCFVHHVQSLDDTELENFIATYKEEHYFYAMRSFILTTNRGLTIGRKRTFNPWITKFKCKCTEGCNESQTGGITYTIYYDNTEINGRIRSYTMTYKDSCHRQIQHRIKKLCLLILRTLQTNTLVKKSY